jgi:LemA protein
MTDFTPLLIIAGLVVAFLLWIAFMYNALVRLKVQCKESWSGIDTELKRRYELIPNLVETVKGYAKHEQETFAKVIEARNRALASTGSPHSQAQDENILVGSLRQLFALSENYPDLKASQNFLHLQAARRFYNANVRDLNTRIEIFPSNLIAGLFSFAKEEFFEIEDIGVRNPPQVSLK